MSEQQLDEATELLFDALEDLNRVRGRRDALEGMDTDELLEKLERSDVQLADVSQPADGPQLSMALKQIDAAREIIGEEVDESTPHSEQLQGDDES